MSYDHPDVKLRVGYFEPGDPLLWPYLPPPLKETFDNLYSSDFVTSDKTVVATDSLVGTDTPYKDWMPVVMDILTSSEIPYSHKQILVSDILAAIEETPTTPEKIKFVTDLLKVLEDFYDVWKGRWDQPVEEMYQSLRSQILKLITEKDVELKVKEA